MVPPTGKPVGFPTEKNYDYIKPSEIRVPFRNMVYIGDSETDIPCMKLVNSYGGYSIGVYDPVSMDKSRVYEMMNQNRIRYFAKADYSCGSEMDILLKNIIDKTVASEKIEKSFFSNKAEAEEFKKFK